MSSVGVGRRRRHTRRPGLGAQACRTEPPSCPPGVKDSFVSEARGLDLRETPSCFGVVPKTTSAKTGKPPAGLSAETDVSRLLILEAVTGEKGEFQLPTDISPEDNSWKTEASVEMFGTARGRVTGHVLPEAVSGRRSRLSGSSEMMDSSRVTGVE